MGGVSSVALTEGRYYMAGYTGESTLQLCEHMQTEIRAIGAPYGSTTVTLSSTTGLVTIAVLGAVTAIDWTHTALRDLLGFTANLSGAASYTATNKARYCWFPSRGLVEYPGDLTEWWAKRSTSYGYRSPDGVTYSTQGTLIKEGKFKYSHLPKADVISVSDTVWETFQEFWTDVIHAGEPFRCFPDRTLNGSGDIKVATFGSLDDDPVGSFTDYMDRNIRSYNGLWTVEMFLWEYLS